MWTGASGSSDMYPMVALIGALFVCVGAKATPPGGRPAQHLGVASCAGSNCHGSTTAQSGQGVLHHNEYLTWQRDDPHSRAYHSLLTARSLAIARHLGIVDPSKSTRCVDCHTDDVPVEQRGIKFSISDGVGCEVCHGGAERWITDHALTKRSHATNLKEGMYATEDPVQRANLCLGCHYGSADKVMTHAVMAAGHPPLLFELTTFTAIEPAHYRVTADYLKRKHYVGPADTWAIGQSVAVSRLLDRFASDAGATPDFYPYNCYSCHQPIQPDSDYAAAGDDNPTRLPIAMSHMRMVTAILNATNPGLAQRWSMALADLHAAMGTSGRTAAINRLRPLAAEITAYLQKRHLDASARRAIALQLARIGNRATFGERSLADQTVMAMTALD
ncbi:MAG: multiheme c-type cytochrome, partial [Gammaproteobacteria bacterium]